MPTEFRVQWILVTLSSVSINHTLEVNVCVCVCAWMRVCVSIFGTSACMCLRVGIHSLSCWCSCVCVCTSLDVVWPDTVYCSLIMRRIEAIAYYGFWGIENFICYNSFVNPYSPILYRKTEKRIVLFFGWKRTVILQIRKHWFFLKIKLKLYLSLQRFALNTLNQCERRSINGTSENASSILTEIRLSFHAHIYVILLCFFHIFGTIFLIIFTRGFIKKHLCYLNDYIWYSPSTDGEWGRGLVFVTSYSFYSYFVHPVNNILFLFAWIGCRHFNHDCSKCCCYWEISF